MDLFGKILVLANFALSLMMAAIGRAVLYYRVDWSDAPANAATGRPGRRTGRGIAKVKELQAAGDRPTPPGEWQASLWPRRNAERATRFGTPPSWNTSRRATL